MKRQRGIQEEDIEREKKRVILRGRQRKIEIKRAEEEERARKKHE